VGDASMVAAHLPPKVPPHASAAVHMQQDHSQCHLISSFEHTAVDESQLPERYLLTCLCGGALF
jgi:hypothetical protein